MMQCTIESLHKKNPEILAEMEKGPAFEVGGNEIDGFHYIWDLENVTPTRKLLDGTHVVELEDPMALTIMTKCPEKWILQDIETGQVYKGSQDPTPREQWKLITTIDEPSPKK